MGRERSATSQQLVPVSFVVVVVVRGIKNKKNTILTNWEGRKGVSTERRNGFIRGSEERA